MVEQASPMAVFNDQAAGARHAIVGESLDDLDDDVGAENNGTMNNGMKTRLPGLIRMLPYKSLQVPQT